MLGQARMTTQGATMQPSQAEKGVTMQAPKASSDVTRQKGWPKNGRALSNVLRLSWLCLWCDTCPLVQVGLCAPHKPEIWGGKPGKMRRLGYGLCARCAPLPALTLHVEARCMAGLGGRGDGAMLCPRARDVLRQDCPACPCSDVTGQWRQPEAGATEERPLEAVRCRPWLDGGMVERVLTLSRNPAQCIEQSLSFFSDTLLGVLRCQACNL